MSTVRAPAVAGQFYEVSPSVLRRQIEGAYLSPLGPGRLPQPSKLPLSKSVALIVPHAGYMYSGPVAARGFAWLASLGRPEAVVCIGPSHWGGLLVIALSTADAWRTPLGLVRIDKDLAENLKKACPLVKDNDAPHESEHSVEVQVPFLQHLWEETPPFLAVLMIDQDLKTSLALSEALAKVIGNRYVALLASTDLSHYFPREKATRLDKHALDVILTGDPLALDRAVKEYGINMCGAGPVMAVLEACRHLGLDKRQLLGYATSGDITGDTTSVVGYGCVAIG